MREWTELIYAGELVRYFTTHGWRNGYFDEYIARTVGRGKTKQPAPPLFAYVTPIGAEGRDKHRVKVPVEDVQRIEEKK